MMNKIDCEDLNRWQTVKRGRYGAAPIKILQGKKSTTNKKLNVPARICSEFSFFFFLIVKNLRSVKLFVAFFSHL